MRRAMVGALLVGCVSGSGEGNGYALYADPADAKEGVATLVGDVASVDGRRVSDYGHRFLLLGGCHTVKTTTTWGGAASDGAVMAHLPEVSFAMDMKVGLTYVVRIGTEGPADSASGVAISAIEQD